MAISKKFIYWPRTILLCVMGMSLCVGIATRAVAANEPAKKIEATKKEEPVKQSGSFLIKFKANTSEAKIQEVAAYYGASKVLPLSGAELVSHKDAEQWKRLKFDAVNDIKDIARRIVQDSRVAEVENAAAEGSNL